MITEIKGYKKSIIFDKILNFSKVEYDKYTTLTCAEVCYYICPNTQLYNNLMIKYKKDFESIINKYNDNIDYTKGLKLIINFYCSMNIPLETDDLGFEINDICLDDATIDISGELTTLDYNYLIELCDDTIWS